MIGRHLFLTSSGLSSDMKKKFFDIIGKRPEDVKVLYVPTAYGYTQVYSFPHCP